MLSQRAASIDVSGIRKVFDLAAQLKDPVNLSIGMPSFDALEPIRKATKQAVDSKKGGYSPTQGVAELRDEVRRHYDVGPGSSRENFDAFITSGVSGGFVLSYMAVLDPEDEVLLPDPFFGMYRDVAALLNAKPVYFDIYPDFHLRIENIEKLVTPKTKAIVVNNPANPTGKSIRQPELDALIEFARTKGLWLIYDEIYSVFTFDHPVAQPLKGYDRVIVLNGASKSHGIPGWRLGWAIAPSEVIGAMTKMQQYTYICTPTLVQHGVLGTVGYDFSEIRDEYRQKRDFVFGALKDKYKMEKSGGAYYFFLEAPGGSGQGFFERCLKKNLLIVPGHCFSRRDTHFRVSFSASQETLERGVEILRDLA